MSIKEQRMYGLTTRTTFGRNPPARLVPAADPTRRACQLRKQMQRLHAEAERAPRNSEARRRALAQYDVKRMLLAELNRKLNNLPVIWRGWL